jgi:hypothetical protein
MKVEEGYYSPNYGLEIRHRCATASLECRIVKKMLADMPHQSEPMQECIIRNVTWIEARLKSIEDISNEIPRPKKRKEND